MRIRRYRSLLALVIVLVAVGAVTSSTSLVIAGALPLLYVLQGTVARTPAIEDRVRIERDVEPETPLPGEPVEVAVTVENVGDAAIPDLRLLDGVPEELGVTEGSPRTGGPLRSGESLTTTYTLVANRGAYEFGEVLLRARNVSATRLTNASVEATGDDAFECRVSIDDVPIRQDTTPYSGPLATDSGGSGVEFYATREYKAGDPVKRINWRRYAKTGDLSTIEYREQRAAHVAVVVDSRPPAHVASGTSLPTGATLSAYAATLAVGVLSEAGHHVGLAALGTPDPTGGRRLPAWVSADETDSFAARAAAICNAAATGGEETISTDMADAVADGGISPTDVRTTPTNDNREFERLRSLLPADSQVLLCTPAVDDAIIGLVESLRADGHQTTVLSPQIATDSIGGRIARLQRAARLDRMRVLGATVVDWDRDERLPIALSRTLGTEVR